MRPYQDYLRSEIAARRGELSAERERVMDAGEKMKLEAEAGQAAAEAEGTVNGYTPSQRLSLQVSRIGSETAQRCTAIAEEVSALNFELRLRDDPEALEECGGPGRD